MEIGAGGTPEARRDAPTASYDTLPGPSASTHGGPSPSSSARRHSHPPATNDHPGLGAARSRPIRARIAANNGRVSPWIADLDPGKAGFSGSHHPCRIGYTRLTYYHTFTQNLRDSIPGSWGHSVAG